MPREKVDMVASGYEWVCPKCSSINREITVDPEAEYECPECHEIYAVGEIGNALE